MVKGREAGISLRAMVVGVLLCPLDVRLGPTFPHPCSPSASPQRCASVVEELARRGADVNGRDSRLSSPLHLVAMRGYHDVGLSLILHGADVNAKDMSQVTPLRHAAYRGTLQQSPPPPKGPLNHSIHLPTPPPLATRRNSDTLGVAQIPASTTAAWLILTALLCAIHSAQSQVRTRSSACCSSTALTRRLSMRRGASQSRWRASYATRPAAAPSRHSCATATADTCARSSAR